MKYKALLTYTKNDLKISKFCLKQKTLLQIKNLVGWESSPNKLLQRMIKLDLIKRTNRNTYETTGTGKWFIKYMETKK